MSEINSKQFIPNRSSHTLTPDQEIIKTRSNRAYSLFTELDLKSQNVNELHGGDNLRQNTTNSVENLSPSMSPVDINEISSQRATFTNQVFDNNNRSVPQGNMSSKLNLEQQYSMLTTGSQQVIQMQSYNTPRNKLNKVFSSEEKIHKNNTLSTQNGHHFTNNLTSNAEFPDLNQLTHYQEFSQKSPISQF